LTAKQIEIETLENSNNVLRKELIGVLGELEKANIQRKPLKNESSSDKYLSAKIIEAKAGRRINRIYTNYKTGTPKEFIQKDFPFPEAYRSQVNKEQKLRQ
jgi:hypothetical protein